MTAVEWLIEQIKSDHNQKALSAKEWMEVVEQAKQIEIDREISDEEIEKAVNNPINDAYCFREGAKWYREQLKQRQC